MRHDIVIINCRPCLKSTYHVALCSGKICDVAENLGGHSEKRRVMDENLSETIDGMRVWVNMYVCVCCVLCVVCVVCVAVCESSDRQCQWENGPRHHWLTPWGRDNKDAICQTVFSNKFAWMTIVVFSLKLHVVTGPQYWFRLWPGVGCKPLSEPNQWWPSLLMHIYATWPQWLKTTIMPSSCQYTSLC